MCEQALAIHKENISKLIESLDPASIAVLGSGYINYILLHDLIKKNRKVYSIDCIENISKTGVSKKPICRSENNCPNCLFCLISNSSYYCKNYTRELLEDGNCSSYAPVKKPFDTCENYDPATDPIFIKANIIGGVAKNFSEKIEAEIASFKTPTQAFTKPWQSRKNQNTTQWQERVIQWNW